MTLPSSLLNQRPDVRAQEAVLHQTSAAVGVATANMLPQVTLTGYVGNERFSYLNLVQSGGIWELAGALTQPLFEGGTLRARRRSAIAQFDEAAANYRQVVLNAFENVADVLTALDNDALAMQANDDAAASAKASLSLIQQQYDDGAASYESLLSAQQIYQRARIDQVRALAARFIDTVDLFQALGGGWWHRADAGVVNP
jgi:NodT family efflux transporter outer membrane factor (OMF) lipoprotein